LAPEVVPNLRIKGTLDNLACQATAQEAERNMAPKIRTILALLLTTLGGGSVLGDTLSAPHQRVAADCAAPAYRQFDFWIGDWDVFDIDQPTVKVARVSVEPILDGCVLLEDYVGIDGHEGQSFSIFDRSRQVWHQSWVTNHGQMLVIEGEMQRTAMVLSGADHTPDGKERRVRGIWKPVTGGVQESAMRSTDAGVTWTPWFDLLFRSHKP
jgi:hypothetical protein